MGQVLILFGFLIYFTAFADHDHNGIWGHEYPNGKTFACRGYHDMKEFAEKFNTAGDHYNFGLCQLHRGHLPGIATMKKAAAMGSHNAAITVAEYYDSDSYTLPQGEGTDNENNLQKVIEYEELALQLIRSQKNYPYDDRYGDDFAAEKEDQPYLKTIKNLAINYMTQFANEISSHLESINEDIGDATLKPLRKVIETADNCLEIPYDANVWSQKIYDNAIDRCTESKRIAQVLLPLEEKRLKIAKAQCQDTKLSECSAHTEIESEMLKLYENHVAISNKILEMLASL